jgi:hypothetical protein
LKSSGFSTAYFIFLVFSEFFSKDKVTIQFETDSNIRNPLDHKGNCPCPTWVTTHVPVVTLAVPAWVADRCAVNSPLCKFGFSTVTLFMTKNTKRLSSASYVSVLQTGAWSRPASHNSHIA